MTKLLEILGTGRRRPNSTILDHALQGNSKVTSLIIIASLDPNPIVRNNIWYYLPLLSHISVLGSWRFGQCMLHCTRLYFVDCISAFRRLLKWQLGNCQKSSSIWAIPKTSFMRYFTLPNTNSARQEERCCLTTSSCDTHFGLCQKLWLWTKWHKVGWEESACAPVCASVCRKTKKIQNTCVACSSLNYKSLCVEHEKDMSMQASRQNDPTLLQTPAYDPHSIE